jgi:FAD/FMN-containing dehydrogenase
VLDKMVFEYVIANKGSISAEHGVGSSKAKYVERIKGESAYKVMKGIKAVFDPRNILNPHTIFSSPSSSDVLMK